MTRIEMPYGDEPVGPSRGGGFSALKMRILVALALVAFALFSYYSRPGDVNPVTGERQRVAFDNAADEIRMGLQAVPQMAWRIRRTRSRPPSPGARETSW